MNVIARGTRFTRTGFKEIRMLPIKVDDEIEFNPERARTKMLFDSPAYRVVLFCLEGGRRSPGTYRRRK